MKKETILEELTKTKIDLDDVYKRVDRLKEGDIPKNIGYIFNKLTEYVGFAQDEIEKAELVLRK